MAVMLPWSQCVKQIGLFEVNFRSRVISMLMLKLTVFVDFIYTVIDLNITGEFADSLGWNDWFHDDIIKWKNFLRYWPFVMEIHWSPVDSPHKGQWCGALMFSLICAWTNDRANIRDAGDLRCHHTHYDVTLMCHYTFGSFQFTMLILTLQK